LLLGGQILQALASRWCGTAGGLRQTIAFSLYLYSAELYRRVCAVGTGLGSAWFRAESSIGSILVGWIVGSFGIEYVFTAFAPVPLAGGVTTLLFAIATRGRVLGELSP
jgi:putative MFS transporter